MSSNSLSRKYIIPDSELFAYTTYLIDFLTADLGDLSKFGLTIEKINQLRMLLDNLEYCKSDPYCAADVYTVTEEKNKLIEQIKQEIRNMTMRCRMKWGVNSLQEKSLGVKGMNSFSNEILLVSSRRVYETMSNLLNELTDTGLTQEVLNNLNELNQSYEDMINDKKNKINDRLTKTQERIRLGNELYDLVSKYSKLGKNYYAKLNSAKYKNYLIYHGKKSKKKDED